MRLHNFCDPHLGVLERAWCVLKNQPPGPASGPFPMGGVCVGSELPTQRMLLQNPKGVAPCHVNSVPPPKLGRPGVSSAQDCAFGINPGRNKRHLLLTNTLHNPCLLLLSYVGSSHPRRTSLDKHLPGFLSPEARSYLASVASPGVGLSGTFFS
jgi:hypothetical protein